MEETLMRPYQIWSDGQCFAEMADIVHALVVIKTMEEEGFEDIVLTDEDEIIFRSWYDGKLENWEDIYNARKIIIDRVLKGLK